MLNRSRRRVVALLCSVSATTVVPVALAAGPAGASTESADGAAIRSADDDGGRGAAIRSGDDHGGRGAARRDSASGDADRVSGRPRPTAVRADEPDPEDCHDHDWPYWVPLSIDAANVNRNVVIGPLAGLSAAPVLARPIAGVQSAPRPMTGTGLTPEPATVPPQPATIALGGPAAGGPPEGGPFIPSPPPPPPAPPPSPPVRPAPPVLPTPAAAEPPRLRLGYPEYLQTASLTTLAALALTGMAGLAALTGLGGLIGYRQAKAGFVMPASGSARFLR